MGLSSCILPSVLPPATAYFLKDEVCAFLILKIYAWCIYLVEKQHKKM